jgi:hypothetical protein
MTIINPACTTLGLSSTFMALYLPLYLIYWSAYISYSFILPPHKGVLLLIHAQLYTLHHSYHHSLLEVEEHNEKNCFIFDKGRTAPPRYIPKHVSSYTNVDQTARTKNRPQWCLTFGPDDFTIFGKNNIPFGLGGCWYL